MEAMGFDPVQIRARGYLLKEPPVADEATMANKRGAEGT
jgi:hypothetical protein